MTSRKTERLDAWLDRLADRAVTLQDAYGGLRACVAACAERAGAYVMTAPELTEAEALVLHLTLELTAALEQYPVRPVPGDTPATPSAPEAAG